MLNRAQIIGNLGRDPEISYTNGGRAVANFSVATTDSWKDKQTGEKREYTEWHKVVAWDKLAEVCGEYLHKGKQVFVEGKIETRKWEKDGVTRYTTRIVATTVKMLGPKDESPRRTDPGIQRAPATGNNERRYSVLTKGGSP
jgi:single-strand DNA-binding protein